MENVNHLELVESRQGHTKQVWKNKSEKPLHVIFYWENNPKGNTDNDPLTGYLLELFSPNETKEISFPKCTFSVVFMSMKLDLKEISIDNLGKVSVSGSDVHLCGDFIKKLLDGNLTSSTLLACLTIGCGTCKAIA